MKSSSPPEYRYTGLYLNGNDLVTLAVEGEDGVKVGRIKNGAVELLATNLSIPISQVNADFNLLLIETNGKYGLADLDGNILVNPRFKKLVFDSDGMLAFCNEKDKWGWINTKGEEVIKAKYKVIGNGFLENGYATVSTTGNKYQIINREGETMAPPKYEKLYPTWTKDRFIARDDEVWGIIATDGTVICEPQFENIAYVREGLFMATSDGSKWGVISDNGTYEGPIEYKLPGSRTAYLVDNAYGNFFSVQEVATQVDKLKDAVDFNTTFGSLADKFGITKSNISANGYEVSLAGFNLDRIGVSGQLYVILNGTPLVYQSYWSSRKELNTDASPLTFYIKVKSNDEKKNAELYRFFTTRYKCTSRDNLNPDAVTKGHEFTIYFLSGGTNNIVPDESLIEYWD